MRMGLAFVWMTACSELNSREISGRMLNRLRIGIAAVCYYLLIIFKKCYCFDSIGRDSEIVYCLKRSSEVSS